MLAATKKHPTDVVEIRFRVPASRADEARRVLHALGGQEAPSSWREALSGFSPGEALRGARAKEGLTQKALAAKLGVSQANLSQMEHDARPIGKAMAKRLAGILDVDYRLFL